MTIRHRERNGVYTKIRFYVPKAIPSTWFDYGSLPTRERKLNPGPPRTCSLLKRNIDPTSFTLFPIDWVHFLKVVLLPPGLPHPALLDVIFSEGEARAQELQKINLATGRVCESWSTGTPISISPSLQNLRANSIRPFFQPFQHGRLSEFCGERGLCLLPTQAPPYGETDNLFYAEEPLASLPLLPRPFHSPPHPRPHPRLPPSSPHGKFGPLHNI